jgi:phosphatidylglycerophosphate synthase
MTAAGPAKLFQLRNLPNLITFFRILLVPVLVVLLEHPDAALRVGGVTFFSPAGATSSTAIWRAVTHHDHWVNC